MTKENEVKEKKTVKITVLVFFILSLITSIFAIYEIFLLSSIEDLIRYIIIGILVLIDFILVFKVRCIFKNKQKKKKESKRIAFILFMFFYSVICALVGIIIFYVYGQLSNINKVYVTYTSDLITMATNDVSSIDEVQNFTIGILSDETSPDGYIIPQEIISSENLNDDNEMKEYDDYSSMIADLYAGEIDATFITNGYISLFSEITGYENIATDTKIIYSKDKKMRKTDTSTSEIESSGKSVTEPFTILLMGIDSTDEVLSKNAVANGDTLILITFNPKTLNATMLSIPRDSYVPIACWSDKAENKITHAAGYGTDCMMNTIEEYFDVNIDYYAKINFKGLVKLVDAVGGVDVVVPKELCTDDSSRGQEICIQPGAQTLNGEQALVFARNRKSLSNGDFGRAQHQQEIVMALINKMKTITDVSKFMEILSTISNSLDTNLTTKQILSFYNVGKDIIKRSLAVDDADLINIQQLYLQGTGQMIYDERMRLVLWDYVPNKNSRNDIIQAMKENLELVEHEEITEFSFSINEPYEKEVIGEGPYKSTTTYSLLPDFTGDSEAQARATASRLGISISFRGTSGYVVSQNYPANKRLDKISGSVILTLSGGTSVEDEEEDNKTTGKDDSKDNSTTSGSDSEDNDEDNTEGGNKDEPSPTPTPTPSPTPTPTPDPSDDPGSVPDE